MRVRVPGLLVLLVPSGCSVGGGGGGTPTPSALAVMRVAAIPVTFTGGQRLQQVTCRASRAVGDAICWGRLAAGARRRVQVRLRLTQAAGAVPRCYAYDDARDGELRAAITAELNRVMAEAYASQ